MAQRRAEKLKKKRISPKQREFYSKLRSSRNEDIKDWEGGCHEMRTMWRTDGLRRVLC